MAILNSAVGRSIDNCQSLEQLEVYTQFNFKVRAAQGFFSGYEFEPYYAPQSFDIDGLLHRARVRLEMKQDRSCLALTNRS